GGLTVLDPPVLVVGPLALIHVEPDKAQRPVLFHAMKEVLNPGQLSGRGPDRGLGQQHRLVSDEPGLVDGPPEGADGRVRWPVVDAVDPDPGDVLLARPPGGDRPCPWSVGLDGPQPRDVASPPLSEQRDDVSPRRHERRRRDVAVAPWIPGGIHLLAEPDD